MALTEAEPTTARRPEVERILDEYNVEWTFDPTMSLDTLDEKRSLGNQARIDQPLIPELMETYVEARKQGDVFPAIVALELRGGKTMTVDGNHRFASAKKVGDKTIPAYRVKATPETVRVLMTVLNVTHGRALSDKEKLYHAFFLVDQGMRIERAAEVLRLPKGKLKTAWALEAANRRAREVGIKNKAWSELSQSIRVRLSQVRTDAAFIALVNLVSKSQIQREDVNKLVTELNNLRSEQAQLDRINQEAAFLTPEIQSSAGGRIPRRQTPKNALRMHLGAINKLNLNDVAEMVSDDEGEILAQICLDAAESLNKLADSLTVKK